MASKECTEHLQRTTSLERIAEYQAKMLEEIKSGMEKGFSKIDSRIDNIGKQFQDLRDTVMGLDKKYAKKGLEKEVRNLTFAWVGVSAVVGAIVFWLNYGDKLINIFSGK